MHARIDFNQGGGGPADRSDGRTLTQRQTDLTRALILDASIALLEGGPVAELTMRSVARTAGLAERTVFRYFASRDELLDAVAAEGARRLQMPEPPASEEELRAAPRALYGVFEARSGLTRALLHPDLLPRMQATTAKRRWEAIVRLIDRIAPRASARDRRIAAANIRYFLAASTWHYFRTALGFSLDESVACAETAIAQAVAAVRRPAARPSAGARRGRSGSS